MRDNNRTLRTLRNSNELEASILIHAVFEVDIALLILLSCLLACHVILEVLHVFRLARGIRVTLTTLIIGCRWDWEHCQVEPLSLACDELHKAHHGQGHG